MLLLSALKRIKLYNDYLYCENTEPMFEKRDNRELLEYGANSAFALLFFFKLKKSEIMHPIMSISPLGTKPGTKYQYLPTVNCI